MRSSSCEIPQNCMICGVFIHVNTHNTYKAQKGRQYKTPKLGPEGRHMQAES